MTTRWKGLTKPLASDLYDIDVVNANTDKLEKLTLAEILSGQFGEPINGVLTAPALGDGTVDIRPPEGEVWCINRIERQSGGDDLVVTLAGDFWQNILPDMGLDPNTTFIINNTRYLQFEMSSTTARDFSYSGFKIETSVYKLCDTDIGRTDPYGVTTIRPAEGKELFVGAWTSTVYLTDGDSVNLLVDRANRSGNMRITRTLYLDIAGARTYGAIILDAPSYS
jgi:hypothetical protein